ncbi:MAG: sporulation protein [Chloroflexi bacterium]|nr:sporulation protein [Chloroflexota bacterium]
MERAKDVMTVRRVYGEPIEKDGVTVIPAANVRGGGGGGSGEGPQGQGRGWGGGVAMSASPAGAFVIKDGAVTWRPAIDVNRTIVGGQIATIVFLLVVRSVAKAFAKRR